MSFSRLSSPPRISIPISIALAAGSQKEDLQRLRRDSPRCTPGSRRRSTRTTVVFDVRQRQHPVLNEYRLLARVSRFVQRAHPVRRHAYIRRHREYAYIPAEPRRVRGKVGRELYARTHHVRAKHVREQCRPVSRSWTWSVSAYGACHPPGS